MNMKELQSIFTIGETVAVEFKRCGNGIENDTYETVCSFLNRFGGELFMGVLDDGTVVGVPEKAAPDMVKNFIPSTTAVLRISKQHTRPEKLLRLLRSVNHFYSIICLRSLQYRSVSDCEGLYSQDWLQAPLRCPDW